MRPEPSRWPPIFGAVVMAIITLAVVYSAVDGAEQRRQESAAAADDRRTASAERKQLLAIVRDLQRREEQRDRADKRLAEYLEQTGTVVPPELLPTGVRLRTIETRDNDGSESTRRIVRRTTSTTTPAVPQPSRQPENGPQRRVTDLPLPEPVGRATDDVKRMVDETGKRAGVPIPQLP
jgi:hypothetical protein